MKKVVLVLVILALLIGATLYFLLHRTKIEAAALLPADNVLYVGAPDIKRMKERWPKTALAQIAAEPSVAEFLKKPLDQLRAEGGGEASDLFGKVDPGSIFLAITSLRENGAHVLIGFEYGGDRKDLDAALGRLHEVLIKSFPGSSTATSDFQGDTVTVFTSGQPRLFSASHGKWGFISNHEATLQMALNRAAGREKSASLASDADFKNVAGHLPGAADFQWFAKPQSGLKLLLAAGSRQGAEVDTKQLAKLQKIQALGGTLTFDGSEQKEAVFVLYPGLEKVPPIDRAPLALTTPETKLFYDASADWAMLASDDYAATMPPQARTLLAAANIDLAKMPQIFGNDFGVIAGWPAASMFPTALITLEVKDRAAAESLVSNAFSAFGLAAKPGEINGARLFTIDSVKSPILDPAIAISDKFAMFSLTTAELERATALKPGAPTLESAPSFQPALAAYKNAGQAFGYLDLKTLFERAFTMIRGTMIGAAAFSPDANRTFDISKFPETETISNHLSPIVYTAKQTGDGFLLESSGTITLSQALLGIGAGYGVFGYMSQMGVD